MSNTASYIGKEPQYGVFITQTETGDGSTTAFSLDYTAATTASLLVSVGGVVQQPAVAFNINAAGTTLTFTGAPGSSEPIWILYLGQTLQVPQATSANVSMITGESALGTAPAAGDYFLLYDADAAAMKKVAYSNLETGDISSVVAGTGLTGGGTTGAVTLNAAGTSNRISVAADAIDIDAAYVGQSSITTLGTITTGVWNGTALTTVGTIGTGVWQGTAVADAYVANDLTISGGTVNNSIIGGSTPAAATFTAFTSTGIDDNSNALAMTIDVSEQVGIGTATPAKQLHITKSAAADLAALSDGANISVDLDASQNFTVTLAGNRTLDNPSNITPGQTGSIFVTQDGTGSRTLSYGSYWDFPGGTAPTMTTTASAVDRIDYIVRTTTSIEAVATLAYS